MKKICAVVFGCIVLLGLCACGLFAGLAEPMESVYVVTWQEQYDLGVRYLSEGNYEEAIIAFTAAIEIDPKRAEAYIGRAEAYIGSGETEENLTAALADYEQAIMLDEANADAYLGLAEVYLAQDDVELAEAVLLQAIETTGESDELLEMLETCEQAKKPDWITDPSIFDEGYWTMNVGPGVGGNYYVLFHTDGTYSFVQDIYVPAQTTFIYGSGSYIYEGTVLTIVDGIISDSRFLLEEDGFISEEEYAVAGAGQEGWKFTLSVDPNCGYKEITESENFAAFLVQEKKREAEQVLAAYEVQVSVLSQMSYGREICDVALFDIDCDGVPELHIGWNHFVIGTNYSIYDYVNGQVVSVGADPDLVFEFMYYEWNSPAGTLVSVEGLDVFRCAPLQSWDSTLYYVPEMECIYYFGYSDHYWQACTGYLYRITWDGEHAYLDCVFKHNYGDTSEEEGPALQKQIEKDLKRKLAELTAGYVVESQYYNDDQLSHNAYGGAVKAFRTASAQWLDSLFA